MLKRLLHRFKRFLPRPRPSQGPLTYARYAVILRAGETIAHSTARRGPMNRWIETYTGRAADEYIAELNAELAPGVGLYKLVTVGTAQVMIRAAQERTYLTHWTRVTEKEWMEALGCLPPEQWLTVCGVNIFRMCEYYADDITWHYARYDGGFFKRRCRTTERYEELAQQVKVFAAQPPVPA